VQRAPGSTPIEAGHLLFTITGYILIGIWFE
jgi:hypothetical protein